MWTFLVLSGIYLVREPLIHPGLARLASAMASTDGGMQVSLDEIDSDWFGELAVRGVEIRGGTGALREASVESLEVRFSLWGILTRRDLTALTHLTVDGVRAEVDMTATASSDSPSNPDWPAPPTSLPAIQGQNIAIDLRVDDDTRMGLEDMSIDSSGTLQSRTIRLRSPVARLTRADSRWSGAMELAIDSTAEQFHIEHLDLGPHRVVQDSTVDWSNMSARSLKWDASLGDGQFRCTGSLSDRDLRGSLEMERADFSEWLDVLPAPMSSVAALVDGRVELALDLDDPLAARASAELAGERVSFRDTSLDTLGLRARLDAGILRVSQLTATQGAANQLRITDLEVPFEEGFSRDAIRSARGALNLVLEDLDRLPLDTAQDLSEHRVEAHGRIEAGRIALEGGQVTVPGGQIEIETASITFPATDSEIPEIDVQAVVDVADMAQLDPLLGTRESSGSVNGSLMLTGAYNSPTGKVALEGRALNIAGIPLGEAEVRADATGERIQLHRLQCTGALGTVEASGAYRIGTGQLEALALEARLNDLEPLNLPTPLGLTAPAEIRATLDGPWQFPTGSIRLEAPGAIYAGNALEEFTLQARLNDGAIEIEEMGMVSPWSRVRASGNGNYRDVGGKPRTFTLSTLVLEKEQAQLSLSRPVAVVIDGGDLSVSRGTLEGNAGSLSLALRRIGENTKVDATVAGLDLSEFLAPLPYSLTGVDAELSLDQNGEGIQVETRGSIRRVYRDPALESLSASWDASLSEGTLRVETLRIGGSEDPLAALSARVPVGWSPTFAVEEGPLLVDGSLSVPSEWAERLPLPSEVGTLRGSLRGALHLEGPRDDLRGQFTCEADDLMLDGPAVADYFQDAAQVSVEFSFEDAVEATVHAVLPELATVNGSGTLDAGVNLHGYLSDPERALRMWRDASLDARARIEVGSLARATRPIESIQRLEGRLDADLTVSGTLEAPEIDGDASLEEGAFRFSQGVPGLEKLTAQIQFDGRSAQLVEVRADLGAAPATLRGEIDWTEQPVRLDLHIEGQELLLARTPTARVRSDTDLHLSGPLDELHLEGKLGLRSSRILQDIDLLPRASSLASGQAVRANSRGFQILSFRNAPLADMTFDLQVDTTDPLIVSTNVASSSCDIHMRILGTGAVPLPQGEILMENTRLMLPGGVMVFPTGRMAFSRENPFIPTLEMRGETRLAGYDVSMHVTGPYDAPEAVLSSSPPLGHKEVLLLILTGTPPVDGGRGQSQRAAQSITLYLAKDILQRMRSGSLDEDQTSLLDRLEIIQGRDVSKSGSETTEASFRLQKSVWMEQDALYLVADRDIYEEFNLGLRIVFRFQ